MRETLIAYIGLNLIMLVEHFIIANHLDRLEEKIDKLKGEEE